MKYRFPAAGFAVLFGVFLMTSPRLQAQAISGDLIGLVRDSSGAAVPGAELEAVNPATGTKGHTRTDAGGEYRFTNLLPGAWDLSAVAPGFAPSTLKAVLVDANKTATVVVQL